MDRALPVATQCGVFCGWCMLTSGRRHRDRLGLGFRKGDGRAPNVSTGFVCLPGSSSSEGFPARRRSTTASTYALTASATRFASLRPFQSRCSGIFDDKRAARGKLRRNVVFRGMRASGDPAKEPNSGGCDSRNLPLY